MAKLGFSSTVLLSAADVKDIQNEMVSSTNQHYVRTDNASTAAAAGGTVVEVVDVGAELVVEPGAVVVVVAGATTRFVAWVAAATTPVTSTTTSRPDSNGTSHERDKAHTTSPSAHRVPYDSLRASHAHLSV